MLNLPQICWIRRAPYYQANLLHIPEVNDSCPDRGYWWTNKSWNFLWCLLELLLRIALIYSVLVHEVYHSLGGPGVLPPLRHAQALQLAHQADAAGHFRQKTSARLACNFIWPRIWRDVK